MFVKLALLTMYLDLTKSKTWRRIILVVQVVAVSFAVGVIIATIVMFTPLAKGTSFLNHMPALRGLFYSNAIIMIVIDMVMYTIPIVLTWNIQVSKMRKLGLHILFGLGFM